MTTDRLLEEIAAGEGEPLSKAKRRIPSNRQERPVSLGCLVRWITTGVLGPNGQRVRLEAARCAGRWLATAKAIQRFMVAQTPQLEGEPAPAPRSAGKRQRSSDRAAKQLTKLGI